MMFAGGPCAMARAKRARKERHEDNCQSLSTTRPYQHRVFPFSELNIVAFFGRFEKRRGAARTNPVVQFNDNYINAIYPFLTFGIQEFDLGPLDV